VFEKVEYSALVAGNMLKYGSVTEHQIGNIHIVFVCMVCCSNHYYITKFVSRQLTRHRYYAIYVLVMVLCARSNMCIEPYRL